MPNKYTTLCAMNIHKRDSREKIAMSIKEDMKSKIIHYLGGKNPSTPFEDFFRKGSRTTFIRYEFKHGTKLPKNYLNELDFDVVQKMNQLIDKIDYLNLSKDILNELEDKQKFFFTKYGCFVHGNFFAHYEKYVEMFSKTSHYYWLDFCSAPTPELISKMMKVIKMPQTKEVYATFYMNHRGKPSPMKVIKGESLEERADGLKKYCEAALKQFKSINTFSKLDSFECEVFDTYNNGVSPMCVIRFYDKNQKKQHMMKTIKIKSGKTIQDYAEASKRFSNKQLAILWKMPIMKIAGLAAAAKRKELV